MVDIRSGAFLGGFARGRERAREGRSVRETRAGQLEQGRERLGLAREGLGLEREKFEVENFRLNQQRADEQFEAASKRADVFSLMIPQVIQRGGDPSAITKARDQNIELAAKFGLLAGRDAQTRQILINRAQALESAPQEQKTRLASPGQRLQITTGPKRGEFVGEAVPSKPPADPEFIKTQQRFSAVENLIKNTTDSDALASLQQQKTDLRGRLDKLQAGTSSTFDIRTRTKKEAEELRAADIATRQSQATIQDIIERVEGNPELISAAGAISRGAETLASQIDGLAKLSGIDIDASRNVSDYTDILNSFEGEAIKSAEIQSAVVNLAFSAAASSGQTGRAVSDRDVERFMREIGASTGSPETFVAVLKSFGERLQRNFDIRREVIAGPAEAKQKADESLPDTPSSEKSDDQLKKRLGL